MFNAITKVKVSSYSITDMNPTTKLYKATIAVNIKVFILLVFVAIGLYACKNNGEIIPVVKTTLLNVVNADINPLNFYQNGTRLNNISSINPGSESDYMSVPNGTTIYQFKIAGSRTPDYIINNYSLKLDSSAHSLFAAGETADKLFLIKDVPLKDSSSVAMIRFVNASPATTNLTVSIGSSLTYSNQAFQSASNFTYIAPGTYTVNIYQAGSVTPLLSPQTITLIANTKYTLFTRGIINGTGQNALSASVVTNNISLL
ncbi:MAG: hypothetical protein JWR67_622 [Mucilaginibacter sp.]|nr:hypothetical protein [Mucilaginibacter sp.]